MIDQNKLIEFLDDKIEEPLYDSMTSRGEDSMRAGVREFCRELKKRIKREEFTSNE